LTQFKLLLNKPAVGESAGIGVAQMMSVFWIETKFVI